MRRPPIIDLLPSILQTAQKRATNFDAALLGAAGIAGNLRDKGFDFGISQYPEPELERLGLYAFRATITGPNVPQSYGYSLGTHEDVSAIALFEAFERHVFRTVLKADQRPEFPATRLWTGETTSLPRRFVVGEPGVYPSTTSGMACHTSYEAALLAACLELCERDVLLRSWFSNSVPIRQFPPDSQHVGWIKTLAEPEHFELVTGTYSTPCGLHVAVAVLLSTHHTMAFLGAGTGLKAEAAIEKACRELLTVWIFDFLTWKERGSLDTFEAGNQIRRYHENFAQIEDLFRRMQQNRQENATQPRRPRDILESLFRDYDFTVVPIGMDGVTHDASSPFLIRAYSPNAIPLFHGEFPLLLRANFDNLKSIANPDHPY